MKAALEPLDWVCLLAEEVGPRRPTGESERRAAELVRSRLEDAGCAVSVAPFRGYSTFAAPHAITTALALAGSFPGRGRSLLAWKGLGLAAAEDGLRVRPLLRPLSRRHSQNVVARIEPAGEAVRTLCLVCHLDSSRSGLIFHPRALPWLHGVIALQGAAIVAAAAAPLLRRGGLGRLALWAARALLAGILGLLAEREVRGVDVPGANDNASGAAAVATLASELVAEPLGSTGVVCLFTGCEESGLIGADAFISALQHESSSGPGTGRSPDWRRDWLFLNFDGVGAPAPLRYLRREGIVRKWSADGGLVRAAEGVASRRPELGLEGSDHNAGLTYDTTPVLARGGRALTLSAQGDTIPNYHSPTDTVENLDPDVLLRAVEVGREMLAAIDGGEADA
ncbi:MAG: M28 family peptidase [Solirubrobacterales bacterium]|nr:M28 family peptidase [Solirubrobacterales bacterium]